MKAIIIDTETTGFKEPQAIEIAYQEINHIDNLEVVSSFEQRYKPSKPIDYGAMAVHHIVEADLVLCEPSGSFKLPKVEYLIGHNIDFDWEVLGKPDIKRICTLALSRYLLPDLDSHTQSAMLYYFEGAEATSKLQQAHSALPDVDNCRLLLKYLLNVIYTRDEETFPLAIEDLYQLSELARIPTKMHFGKHRGEFIKDIPYGYKSWLLKQPDVDPYLQIALRK